MKSSQRSLRFLSKRFAPLPFFAVICVIAALVSPATVLADHQYAAATLTGCCGSQCASCTGTVVVEFAWNAADCFPNCMVVGSVAQNDTGCTIPAGSILQLVRPDAGDGCVDDTVDPFSLSFTLDSPFSMSHTEMCEVLTTDVVVRAGTVSGNATFYGNPTKALFQCLPDSDVPTVSEWGLMAFGFVLLTAGTVTIRRRYASEAQR